MYASQCEKYSQCESSGRTDDILKHGHTQSGINGLVNEPANVLEAPQWHPTDELLEDTSFQEQSANHGDRKGEDDI